MQYICLNYTVDGSMFNARGCLDNGTDACTKTYLPTFEEAAATCYDDEELNLKLAVRQVANANDNGNNILILLFIEFLVLLVL